MKAIIIAYLIIVIVAVCIWAVPSFLEWLDYQFSDALPDDDER